MPTPAKVLAVHLSATHDFSKPSVEAISLLAGLGVEGDAHCGARVKHRSRVAKNPDAPNLRQVHLIQAELLDELKEKGFDVSPGELGENITTRGIDLLALPVGAVLRVGNEALVAITGLRNPCQQIENFHKGLLAEVLDRSPDGRLIRKAGVMGVVVAGGLVRTGNEIAVALPPEPHRPLNWV